MEPHEYVTMKASHNPYELPEWFFEEDSEKVDWDRGYAYLEEAGYVVSTDNDRFIYTDDLKEDYPEVYRMLYDFHMAEIQQELDYLVENGLVEASLNEDGEMVYSLSQTDTEETLI